jgi:hypothetical protein
MPKAQFTTAAAVWDRHDRRAAVAKILRLDRCLRSLFPSQRSGEDVATNIDVERMAASFAITAPAKKKPRH